MKFKVQAGFYLRQKNTIYIERSFSFSMKIFKKKADLCGLTVFQTQYIELATECVKAKKLKHPKNCYLKDVPTLNKLSSNFICKAFASLPHADPPL